MAVVAGYTALFAFGSSLATAERLERHQRLVDQIRTGITTEDLSLPLPAGFGIQAVLVADANRPEPPTLRLIDGAYWPTSRSPLPLLVTSNAVLEVRQNITASIQTQRRISFF